MFVFFNLHLLQLFRFLFNLKMKSSLNLHGLLAVFGVAMHHIPYYMIVHSIAKPIHLLMPWRQLFFKATLYITTASIMFLGNE